MKTIEIEIEGTSPLMQHRMDEGALFALLGNKQKKAQVAEELTPRQIADKAAYKDDRGYYVPSEYFVGAFKHTAADYKDGGKSRRSLKSVAAGVFRPVGDRAHLIDSEGKVIQSFEVDVRKATNHTKGAVAVCRPRFDRWKCKLAVEIDDTVISIPTAHAIFDDAGKRAGIGSFRVSKGGFFGQYRVTSWKEIQ